MKRRRDRDGLPCGEVRLGRVDQEQLRPRPVDDGEQRRTREPGPVRLPLVPGQVLGQPVGGDGVLRGVVEAPAVDLPFLARGAVGHAGGAAQHQVERDEVEAGPDPGDGRDDVQPAHREGQPVPHDGRVVHGHPSRIGSDPGSTTDGPALPSVGWPRAGRDGAPGDGPCGRLPALLRAPVPPHASRAATRDGTAAGGAADRTAPGRGRTAGGGGRQMGRTGGPRDRAAPGSGGGGRGRDGAGRGARGVGRARPDRRGPPGARGPAGGGGRQEPR